MSDERCDPAILQGRETRASSERPPDTHSIALRPFLLILVAALAWRLAIAWQMPVISRDGVGFCWNARALGRTGLAALQSPEFNQHPLYAVGILVVQWAVTLCGLSDSPTTWQLSGQIVSMTCGLIVVALCGILAARVARAINAPAPPSRVALIAMLLAALLPLNVWLSVDVMSEQIFLVFYLAAATLLLGNWRPIRAGIFGIFVGLAFLTRPEGAALGIAGVVAVLANALAQYRRNPLQPTGTFAHRREAVTSVRQAPSTRPSLMTCLGCLLLMAAGFLAVAAPYWTALGRISPKAEKQTLEQLMPDAALSRSVIAQPLVIAGSSNPRLLVAAVSLEKFPFYEAAGVALLETARAARVVLLLAALPALWVVRKKLAGPVLIGLLAAALLHFTLTVLLLYRHGYLSPRHTLVVVILNIPWSALSLEHLWRVGLRANRPLGILLFSAILGVLAGYAIRVPNQNDAHLLKAAAWLQALPQKQPDWILVGGDSLKRVAFYADIKIRDWHEEAPTTEQRAASILARLRDQQPPPRFLGIETDLNAEPGDEPYGNDLLLKSLRKHHEIGPRLRPAFATPRQTGGGLVIYELRE